MTAEKLLYKDAIHGLLPKAIGDTIIKAGSGSYTKDDQALVSSFDWINRRSGWALELLEKLPESDCKALIIGLTSVVEKSTFISGDLPILSEKYESIGLGRGPNKIFKSRTAAASDISTKKLGLIAFLTRSPKGFDKTDDFTECELQRIKYPESPPKDIVDLILRIGSHRVITAYDQSALAEFTWINEKWMWSIKLALLFSQDDCERLLRGLYIIVHKLNWMPAVHSKDGIAPQSLNILFHVFEQRFPKAVEAIFNWVTESYNEKPFVFFGRQTSARVYEEYIQERKEAYWSAKISASRAELKPIVVTQLKKRSAAERQSRHNERIAQGKERARKLRELNRSLKAMPMTERITLIASSDVPLEGLPKVLLSEASQSIPSLEEVIKQKLIDKMDRRNNEPWRAIKLSLGVKKKKYKNRHHIPATMPHTTNKVETVKEVTRYSVKSYFWLIFIVLITILIVLIQLMQ